MTRSHVLAAHRHVHTNTRKHGRTYTHTHTHTHIIIIIIIIKSSTSSLSQKERVKLSCPDWLARTGRVHACPYPTGARGCTSTRRQGRRLHVLPAYSCSRRAFAPVGPRGGRGGGDGSLSVGGMRQRFGGQVGDFKQNGLLVRRRTRLCVLCGTLRHLVVLSSC